MCLQIFRRGNGPVLSRVGCASLKGELLFFSDSLNSKLWKERGSSLISLDSHYWVFGLVILPVRTCLVIGNVRSWTEFTLVHKVQYILCRSGHESLTAYRRWWWWWWYNSFRAPELLSNLYFCEYEAGMLHSGLTSDHNNGKELLLSWSCINTNQWILYYIKYWPQQPVVIVNDTTLVLHVLFCD